MYSTSPIARFSSSFDIFKMADNDRNNGADEHMSQWFSMYPNHHRQQQQQQQPEPQQRHQGQSTMMDDGTNVYSTVAATQHPQQSEDYPVPQYANQYQSQLRPLEANLQVYQHRGTLQQQISTSQDYQHNQHQYQRQPYSDYLQHTVQNAPTIMPQTQQSVISTHDSPAPIGTEDRNNSQSKAQIRSERKRTREKQRRESVNKQFEELAKVLKRLKYEERDEVNQNAKRSEGNASSTLAALNTVHLPYVSPNNTVDLIASATIYLQHLQQVSKRQQEAINQLEDELKNTKKAGEDTASKLKDVLFNCQVPRPHPGLTNPNFNVDNSRSKGDTNRGDISNSNTHANTTPAIAMNMASMMNGELQQSQQQVMMILPMMMNMGSTATMMGQGAACNMPNIAMQSISAGSSSRNDSAFPSSMQGTESSSTGGTSASSNIPLNPSPHERSTQPLRQPPTLGQYSTQQQQQQQDGNVRQDSTKKPSDKK